MKIINKVVGIVALTFLFTICAPISVEAASGKIIFNDPTTPAGEEVDVTIEVVTYNDDVDRFNIVLEYDSEIIQYVSSEYTQYEEGKLIFNSENSDMVLKDTLVFRALKNETTIVTISTQEVFTEDGQVFAMREGTSQIKIVGGVEIEPVEVIERVIVQVQGVDYYISSDFLESKLPMGYELTEMELEGNTYTVGLGELSDIVLVYLEKTEEVEDEEEPQGSFFMYDSATGVYRPFIQIKVSDSTQIAFLNEEYPEELPERYIPTTMTADGFEFIAWEDAQNRGFYIIYAINSNGEKGLYSYDLIDQSYQRFVIQEDAPNPNEIENEDLQEIIDFMAGNLLVTLLIMLLIQVFTIILVLVFGIKLFNRNKELDDIYTDAGIFSKEDTSANHTKASDYEYEEEFEDEDELDLELNFEEDDSLEEDIPAEDNFMGLGMIDDGLTQEFNINVDEKYFSENEFISFADDNENNNQELSRRDASPREIIKNVEKDEFDNVTESLNDEYSYKEETRNREKKSRFGRKKKSTGPDNDDDGFEFIDL